MAATMLIVEDESDISYILRTNFKKDGFNVLVAGTAEAGLKLAQRHDPEIVLLDIMLPGIDGLEMLRELRKTSSAPVLFLTAKKDEIDRVLGLKLGADDYVTKPSIEELRLRVRRVLRAGVPAAAASRAPARAGGVEIDFERHEVRARGRLVRLAPREFQLLKLLVDAKGKVLSREQLATELWGEDLSHEMDLRGVDQHVARLRKKLAPERDAIATVSSQGYKARVAAPSGRAS